MFLDLKETLTMCFGEKIRNLVYKKLHKKAALSLWRYTFNTNDGKGLMLT